jgi:hypothetical protein
VPQLKCYPNVSTAKSAGSPKIGSFTQYAILFSAGTAGLFIIGVCIYLAARGIDLTDESFYILWVAAPNSYAYAGTLFGHLLSPLFGLVGEDIVLYRRVGLLVLALLGLLGWLSWCRPLPAAQFRLTIVSFGVAALPLYYMSPTWLITPSYDWLGVVASLALLGALGLLLHDKHRWRAAGLGAIAGVCAVASRPPAGFAFALIYVVGIALAATSFRRFLVDYLMAAAATVFLVIVIAIFVVDVEAIRQQVLAFLQLWSGPHQPPVFAQHNEFAKRLEEGPLLLLQLIVFIAALVAHFHLGTRGRQLAAAGLTVTIILIAYVSWFPPSANWRLNFLPTHVALAVNTITLFAGEGLKSWRRHAILALAALIPWAAFLGTGNDYPQLAPQAAGASAIIVLIALQQTFSLSVVATANLVLLAALGWALSDVIAHPYRLPTDLWSQTKRFNFPGHGSVAVDPLTYGMLMHLRRAATANGFVRGQPVLDFTGESPGLVLALGGTAPGTPWLLGGYEWSERQLRFVLAAMDPEARRKARVIWGGPYAYSEKLLRELGFDLERNYHLVAAVERAGRNWTVLVFAP